MSTDVDTDSSPPPTAPATNHSVPVLYQYCLKAYELMDSTAKDLDADQGTVRIRVWEGFLTRLIYEEPLSLSTPYYTSIRKHLINMGCIRQLQRGGGTTPSRWELLKAPCLEDFTKVHGGSVTPNATHHAGSVLGDQRHNDLSKRVSVLESNIKTIMDAIVPKQSAS